MRYVNAPFSKQEHPAWVIFSIISTDSVPYFPAMRDVWAKLRLDEAGITYEVYR